ncbi:PA-phosphatase related-family protein DDB_G0284367 [Durusdinium trenchii]|uniref:PA-phosphatase related-family protein DDB_G0284367 n=1 Tax=Durusdinium trenchii TaxID=1381693 RepID=A0ABP0R7W8_9DINO
MTSGPYFSLAAEVGYFRPYFYEECGLDRSTGECLTPTEDGRKSFPSGHASTSFCAMLFTSLYLLGKVTRKRHLEATGSPLRPLGCTNVLLLLALSPVMVAFWVAASRVRENDHHPADVVTGACIGSAWAVLWYVRYFTRLWDDHDDHQSTDGSSRTTESQRAGDEDLPMTA